MSLTTAVLPMSVLADVRPDVNLRDSPKLRRRGQQMGHAIAAAGRGQIFKKYWQLKLQMQRETPHRLNRRGMNEEQLNSVAENVN